MFGRLIPSGRPGFNISESEIRYAMQNTNSCAEAARFLKVSVDTYRKYANMFTDSESGLTLYELHKNKPGTGTRKRQPPSKFIATLDDILDGKYPKYDKYKLKVRLLRSGTYEECCENCGFDERRISDYTVPLILDWIDGDQTNHTRENLRFLCYNCYYLIVGSPDHNRMRKSY